MPSWFALAARLTLTPNDEVRWIAPPRGTLRHGWFWSTHPRIVAVVVVSLVVLILGTTIYRRFRRR
jgi:hypothetical protein